MNITIKEVPNRKILVLKLSEAIPNDYEDPLFPIYPEDNPNEMEMISGLEVVFAVWKQLYVLEGVYGVAINPFEITIETHAEYGWQSIEADILYILAMMIVEGDTVGIKRRKHMFKTEKEKVEQEIDRSGKQLQWIEG